MSWADVRLRTSLWHLREESVATRVLVSVGFAGFLSLLALVSFPLPWTPVPFSMMPFALLVAGAVQKPQWSLLSVAIYLIAGGLGAQIFAEGASGWSHFGGHTAGYLLGFLLVSPLVSAYVARPRRTVTGAWRSGVIAAVAVAAAAGLLAIAWLWRTGQGFTDIDDSIRAFGTGASVAWIAVFLATVGVLTLVAVRGTRKSGALQLFFVMLAAIIALHACGVTVLWLATPLSLMAAIVVGSIVFLPFDILKAGLAVAATLPFLPTEPEHA